MADQKQVKLLTRNVKGWNKWRKDHPGDKVDLILADLLGVDLREANLSLADLRGASLRGAHLGRVDLSAADLSKADLSAADLSAANLSKADLSKADLTLARLWYADLGEANLSEAHLDGADITAVTVRGTNFAASCVERTIFGNCDLSESLGLQTVFHRAASTIGTDTISRSKGKIPTKFLRGCGLSDWEIEAAKLYDPDLSNDEITDIQYRIYELRATRTIQTSPLFISYSHADSPFVDELEKLLNEKGIRFWRDIHNATAGRLEKQIDRAIRQNPTVLLVLSKDSIGSDWVEHEVNLARKLEKETKRDVLCPVALDDSWKKSSWSQVLMEQVVKYYVLDCSCWADHDEFERVFVKLVDGLNLYYRRDK
jgi:uncharacterized protein YjbI with pentapeptide repeats